LNSTPGQAHHGIMRILVTGGLGFIGSNFIRLILAEHPEARILNLDSVTYAGNPDNLADLPADCAQRHQHLRVDITDPAAVEAAWKSAGTIDGIIHFAAESHVDRSIHDPQVFLRTNVLGTQILLEQARRMGTPRFVMVSTDEVYGSLGPSGAFTETTPLDPRSPYSASKAAADHLTMAYFHTFGLPTVITRCSNNYGPFQFPEKLIPLMILHARDHKPLPVYGDGRYVRDWIHVEDHCRGVWAAFEKGRAGEVYNFGARNEAPNLDIVHRILQELERPESLIRHVADRPGHDRRYAIDPHKAETELSWRPQIDFPTGLAATIQWYLQHSQWVERVTTGAYREYLEDMYGERIRTSTP
jgi:dTDP-glucose 4,6-dehydratase